MVDAKDVRITNGRRVSIGIGAVVAVVIAGAAYTFDRQKAAEVNRATIETRLKAVEDWRDRFESKLDKIGDKIDRLLEKSK